MRMKFEEKMNQLHSLNRTFHLASVDYKNKMEDMEFDTLNLRDKKDELEKFL